MLLLELTKEDAETLAALIAQNGGTAELAREERYFGDAQSVTMIIQAGTAIVNLVAATLSVWSAVRTVKGAVAGKPFELQQSTQEDVKAVLLPPSPPPA